ncbi:MAG: hypothetical protein AAF552_10690 [Pseudomonadota bacterium]
MRRLIMLTLLLWSAGAAIGATLKLADGSSLRGEVVSLSNDVYTVRSDSLGTVKVPAADVVSISYGRSTERDSSGSQAQLQKLQNQLAADATTMSMIGELQNDPQLQAILADPEIMRAVATGDLTTLMANEKFMAIMNNEKIRAITRQATGDK